MRRLDSLSQRMQGWLHRLYALPGRLFGEGAARPAVPRIAYYFPTGAHYDRAVGQRLYDENPVFRDTMQQCDREVQKHLGLSLVERYFSGGPAVREEHSAFSPGEPALLAAVQIGLVECWRTRGLEPDAVIGECGGDIAAAYTAHALSLEEAMRVGCASCRYVFGQGSEASLEEGYYVFLEATPEEAEKLCAATPHTIYICDEVAPTRTLLFGSPAAVDAFVKQVRAQEYICHVNPKLSVAVHSPLNEHAVGAYFNSLASLAPRPPACPAYSLIDTAPLGEDAYAAYHWIHIAFGRLHKVRALKQLVRDGYTVLLTMSVANASLRWVRQGLPDPDYPLLLAVDPRHKDGEDLLALPEEQLRTLGLLADEAARRPVQRVESVSSTPQPQANGTVATLDLLSPDVLRDPYPYYRHLRRYAPVKWSEGLQAWVVSRYADVVTVLKTPAVFSSAQRSVFDPVLLGTDPPEHTRISELLAEPFGKKEIADLTARIQFHTDRCLDHLLEGGHGELLADVAAPLPVYVIADILGLDAARYGPDLKRWADAAVLDAGQTLTPEEEAARLQHLHAFDTFLRDVLTARRETPVNGLLSTIAHAAPGGVPLTLDQQVSLARLFVVAGHETTTYLIANAFLALLRHRPVYRMLRETPEQAGAFVDEVLRYDSPVLAAPRRTVQPCELAGRQIPADAEVIALLASANHDEAVFDDPGTFRLHRPRPSLSFGSGPHVCLGIHLARLETRIVIERILARTHHFWCDEPLASIAQVGTLTLRRVTRLPLRLIMR